MYNIISTASSNYRYRYQIISEGELIELYATFGNKFDRI